MNDKNRVYPFLGTKNKVTKDSMTCSDESAINFHMTLIFKHFYLNFQQGPLQSETCGQKNTDTYKLFANFCTLNG